MHIFILLRNYSTDNIFGAHTYVILWAIPRGIKFDLLFGGLSIAGYVYIPVLVYTEQISQHLMLILLTWFNFYPSMDK